MKQSRAGDKCTKEWLNHSERELARKFSDFREVKRADIKTWTTLLDKLADIFKDEGYCSR